MSPKWLPMLAASWVIAAQAVAAADDPSDTFQFTTAKRAGYDWWALQPLQRPVPPQSRLSGWAVNPIDSFILARLERHDLKPAPPAAPHTLLRRLHANLTGLPPSPREVMSFLEAYAQNSQQAVEAVVDRLLKSPHYGERWARHWLDVARYGESDGYEYDALRPSAWPYRDWVIQAFNQDMPYDRFVRLQIAGDILEPSNADAVTATSFLVCGAFDGLRPQGEKMRQIMRQDELEDLVGTVAQSFLGLTVHCARCHDHKFDPISQKEYYQLASALAGVHRGDRSLPPEHHVVLLKEQLRDLQAERSVLDASVRETILQERANTSSAGTEPPRPISCWTFDRDLEDEMGPLHGQAHGGARTENGALRLDGESDYVATAPLEQSLKEKTLEAWVKLDNLKQRGGSALSLQSLDGGRFDAIVFGEREPGKWMAGSDGFRRTKSFQGPAEAETGFVHVALAYDGDGTIRAYRNGQPYGKPYRSDGPVELPAGQTQVLFGLRHGTKPNAGFMLAGLIDRAQLYDRALSSEEIAASANADFVSESSIVERLTLEQRTQRDQWNREIVRIQTVLEEATERQAYSVTPKAAPVAHLLVRGSPFQPAEAVAPAGVATFPGIPADFGLAPDADEALRRRKLAEWITQPDNPLLARVMVNRLWHYHFGQGLVKTPNDFGFSGGEASHPELLDWLASEFRARGWSLKSIHRLIVTSAVFSQSSAFHEYAASVDGDNRLLWRFTPKRLEAEAVRDYILHVSGQLNPAMGGPGFRDFDMYKPKGSWVYDSIDPEGAAFNRRSIYRTWARGSQHPLLTTFDCPDPSATAPVRSVTTTPLGALALMNDSFVLRMADHFADRLTREASQSPSRMAALGYELAFARSPDSSETERAAQFIEHNGLPAFCRVLFNATEFLYVD